MFGQFLHMWRGQTTGMDDVTAVHMFQNDVILPKSYKEADSKWHMGFFLGLELEG